MQRKTRFSWSRKRRPCSSCSRWASVGGKRVHEVPQAVLKLLGRRGGHQRRAQRVQSRGPAHGSSASMERFHAAV